MHSFGAVRCSEMLQPTEFGNAISEEAVETESVMMQMIVTHRMVCNAE